jgi:DnaB-like helicase C terminal domain
MAFEEKGRELVFRVNQHAEQVVLAAEIVSAAFRKEFARNPPDVFLTEEHRVTHAAIREAEHRGLGCDPATLNRLSSGNVDVAYLADLLAARPDVPDEPTLRFHVEMLLWDRQRHMALTGPISSLLEALQKGEVPERVRALSRGVVDCFEGWSDRRHLADPEELIRDQLVDLRLRMSGRAVYPFGIAGLDFIDPPPEIELLKPLKWRGNAILNVEHRMIPAAAPGQVTVITGIPGSGKSTVTALATLGLVRQRRRVLYGAWEMRGGTTLELLAIQSLAWDQRVARTLGLPGNAFNWSRKAFKMGRFGEEQLALLEIRMREISKYVRFLRNPFRRRSGEKSSNERNLDLVQGYLSDSGCEVFVADLWKRCLVKTDPDDEEEALYRQQAMCEELDIHAILVQQQRLKDIEARPDKRPTREGIKGSGAWVEVADNMIGIHRQHLWKDVEDNELEMIVLKQRYGDWPLAVSFEWFPDQGLVAGGRSVKYDQSAGGIGSTNPVNEAIEGAKRKGKWGK